MTDVSILSFIYIKYIKITQKKTYRISITGPESTGKSALAEQLAKHFKATWVPEYSREYLRHIGRDYTYDDILAIAQGQLVHEEQMMAEAENFLFCDTEQIVNKIWCEEKFGRCHPWIQDKILAHRYDLYLLCEPDLLWEADPFRENPEDRERLFELYKKELEVNKFPFVIINGQGKERLTIALEAIRSFFPGSIF